MTRPPIHRMPWGFGPMPGPRQAPGGGPHHPSTPAKSRAVSLTVPADPTLMADLLPRDFTLDGDQVTFRYTELENLEWLAGRGYRMLGVMVPARYEGRRDRARGQFLTVLWENLADPILSGREELGYAKLFSDLERTAVDGGERITASWMGHVFFTLSLGRIDEAAIAPDPVDAGDGLLHYKYIPRTGALHEPEIAHACLTPVEARSGRLERVATAPATLAFQATDWQQMPTQAHIVAALDAILMAKSGIARIEWRVGTNDLFVQRRLE